MSHVDNSTIVGEYDRERPAHGDTDSQRVGRRPRRTLTLVNDAIGRAGTPPRGATVAARGQIAAMQDTFSNIAVGLGVAVLAIFLLLAANFQSVRLAVVVVSTVPAALAGVAVMLWAAGNDRQRAVVHGAIMAIGVAVANAILLVTFAERRRRSGGRVGESGIEAALPYASSLDDQCRHDRRHDSHGVGPRRGADATAPLGRAVIGGPAAATLATLLILPFVYALPAARERSTSPSLDPDDPRAFTARP